MDAGQARFGICGCGEAFGQRFVEIRVTVDGSPVVHDDVQQGACPSCGTRVYQAAVVSALERLRTGTSSSR